jgi:hypothetical protein
MNSGDSELLRSSHFAASMTFSVRTSPALVATPHVVHQDVNRVGLADDQFERRFHLGVDSMVAADACNPLMETLMVRR